MAKITPLAEIHAELDAKMIPFCGWNLPANYPGGAVAEHKYTRKFCSVFDASYNGKIRVAGAGCPSALAALLTGEISALAVGESANAFILSEKGTLIDALAVLRMAEEDFFLVTHTENTAKVLARLQEKLPAETAVQDLSDPIAQLTLAGPAAAAVLAEAGAPEDTIPSPGHCGMTEITDIRCIINAGGWAGDPGFDLFCSADNAIDLWDELTCIEPVRPAGINTKDSLRIEAGCPAYGPEYTAELTLADLPGHETEGTAAAAFILIQIEGKVSAKSGDKIFSADGSEIGVITSAAQAPCLDSPCAIGKVAAAAKPACGDKISIKNSTAEISGTVVPALYTSPRV